MLDKSAYYCSFCGKSQHEVRKLIAGATAFICDECIVLCLDIMAEEGGHIKKTIHESGETDYAITVGDAP